MSEKKMIQINPTFLKTTGNNKQEKRNKKKRDKKNKDTLKAILKPNNIKASLINRIKNHQREKQRTLKKINKNKKEKTSEFADSFDEHLNYLENIVSKKKKQKEEKRRKKLEKEKLKQSSSIPIPKIVLNTSIISKNKNNTSETNTLSNKQKTSFNEKTFDREDTLDNTSQLQSNSFSKIETKDNDHIGISTSFKNESFEETDLVKPSLVDKNLLEPFAFKKSDNINNESFNSPTSSGGIFENLNKTLRNEIKSAIDPPYGCLKNGKKPTYSQYQKTLKKHQPTENKINPQVKLDFIEPMIKPPPSLRSEKLELLKNKFNTTEPKTEEKKIYKLKKTVKIFKLGKNKNNRVGVLIKSGKTRKQVKNETSILKERCLSDIKEYLRKHNLIKVGTTAPEDVLRRIYEDSFLSGNVYNKNSENLIYNYLNDDSEESM